MIGKIFLKNLNLDKLAAYMLESIKDVYVQYQLDQTSLALYATRYSPAQEELRQLKILGQNIIKNLIHLQPNSMEVGSVNECLSTGTIILTEQASILAQEILTSVLILQRHLSFCRNTNAEAYMEVSGLGPYQVKENFVMVFDAMADMKNTIPDTSILQQLSEKVATILHYTADQSLICDLIPFAHLSEAIAMAGTFHTLVGVLGFSVFVKAFSTLNGNFLMFLKMVWYNMSFKKIVTLCCQAGTVFIQQNSLCIGGTIFFSTMVLADPTGTLHILKETLRYLSTIDSVAGLIHKILSTGFIGSSFLKTAIAAAEAATKLLKEIQNEKL